MAQPDARYYRIALEPDLTGAPGSYELKFNTMPGMASSISELRMGDLDALARILANRNDAASGETVVAAPRPPASGEPCVHCTGVGSGCHCDIEWQ